MQIERKIMNIPSHITSVLEGQEKLLADFLLEVTKGGAEIDGLDRYPSVRKEADKYLHSSLTETIKKLAEEDIAWLEGERKLTRKDVPGLPINPPKTMMELQYEAYNVALENVIQRKRRLLDRLTEK